MSELVDFLLARIADDEAAARAVVDEHEMWDWDSYMSSAGWYDGSAHNFAQRNNPVRVLAESDAKRRILAEHPNRGTCETCLDSLESEEGAEGDVYSYASMKWEPCPTLRFLALPYADHEDYREEWRP